MEHDNSSSAPAISEPEGRFLNRLSSKYEKSEQAGRLRSYLIASLVILAMFAISRLVLWWWLALVLVEALGLFLFHQYKRFGSFKSRLLRKLWALQSEKTD